MLGFFASQITVDIGVYDLLNLHNFDFAFKCEIDPHRPHFGELFIILSNS